MEVVEPMRLAKDPKYLKARADLGKIRDTWVHGLAEAGNSPEKRNELRQKVGNMLRTFKAKYDHNVQ